MKYRKKPVVIDAIQLIDNDLSISDCLEFIENIDMNTCMFLRYKCIEDVRKENGITIHTLEGDMRAAFGDYIIKDVNGEMYPCKPDIFEKTYELVIDKE